MTQPPEPPGYGPGYDRPGYGQPPYTGPGYEQPGYGSTYGQPGYGTGGPPPSGGDNNRLVWAVSGAVVLVAIVVTLIVVLNSGGSGSPQAKGSGSPTGDTTVSGFPSGSTVPSVSSAPSDSPVPSGSSGPSGNSAAGGSGTALPSSGTSATPNAGYTGLNCPPGDSASSSVIHLKTALEFSKAGETPSDFDQDIFNACATDTVRPRLAPLYGIDFGLPGTDLTGGDDEGPVARYAMTSKSGAQLTITMVRTKDNRYVCTDFAFTAG